MLVSITAMDQYRHKSVEELRLEDYELGQEAGRWWPGGALRVE
jgi:aminopeptidase C